MCFTTSASEQIIHDLRCRVNASFASSSGVLMNIVDGLAVGPRIGAPFELVLSPIWGYEWSSLYTGLRRAAHGDGVSEWRRARIEWLQEWGDQVRETDPRLGPWRVRVLDATNYDRPKAETVRRGYVHGVDGMKPGHGLSVLTERVGPGAWQLPLEMALIPVGQSPTAWGAAQVVAFVQSYGWNPDELLLVDAAYTNAPTLRPMKKKGVNVLGRVSSKRVFYLSPPAYAGHGRPRVRGRKIKLNDGRTLPEPDQAERVRAEAGRSFDVARWNDVRMRAWPEQPLVLYRVIEYRADGTRRYKRPLWLIYLGDSPAPSPDHAPALYPQRFGVEHGLRFEKGELALVAGQFFGPDAERRVQVWVELVATALWWLWALRLLARAPDVPWPRWWRQRRLTPGTVRRLAPALLFKLGIDRPRPQLRGKSPGRPRGLRLKPRPRYKIYRKRVAQRK